MVVVVVVLMSHDKREVLLTDCDVDLSGECVIVVKLLEQFFVGDHEP